MLSSATQAELEVLQVCQGKVRMNHQSTSHLQRMVKAAIKAGDLVRSKSQEMSQTSTHLSAHATVKATLQSARLSSSTEK
jgi:hypothetical protein